MTNPNDPMPDHQSPAYPAWYRRNVDPNWQGPNQPQKKQGHKVRWSLLSLLGLIAIIVIASVASGGGSKSPAKAAASSSSSPLSNDGLVTAPTHAKPKATHATLRPTRKPAPTHVAPKPTPTPAPTTHVVVKPKPAPKPALTTSEEQAIESANSYLSMGGFSRAGLINQLTSKYGEGFSATDAVFAVDHVKVNWNQQAVESAKSYLQMGGFSRAGLIDQLTSQYGEKFTLAQATYAVDHVGL